MKSIEQIQGTWVPRAGFRGLSFATICALFVLLLTIAVIWSCAFFVLLSFGGHRPNPESGSFEEFAQLFAEAVNQMEAVPDDQFPVTYRLNSVGGNLILLPAYTTQSELVAKFGRTLGFELERHVSSNDQTRLVLANRTEVGEVAALSSINVPLDTKLFVWKEFKGEYFIAFEFEIQDDRRVIRFVEP